MARAVPLGPTDIDTVALAPLALLHLFGVVNTQVL